MDHLKQIRRQRKLTQKQMAQELGISHTYYRQLENDFKVPSYRLLVTIKSRFPETDMNQLLIIEEKC